MKKLCLGVVAALSLAAVSLSQAQPASQPQMAPGQGAGMMTKVTLKIKAPMSLVRQQKTMNKPNEITIGARSFKLPPGVEEVTVMHNLGNVEMTGKPVPIRIAYRTGRPNSRGGAPAPSQPASKPPAGASATLRGRRFGAGTAGGPRPAWRSSGGPAGPSGPPWGHGPGPGLVAGAGPGRRLLLARLTGGTASRASRLDGRRWGSEGCCSWLGAFL